MDGSGELRISDDDRERYFVVLRRAFGEGRITEGELEERLQQVYGSRTEVELRSVVADLPADLPVNVPAESVGRWRGASRRSLARVVRWYFPALICTGIWAITDFGGYFWPAWVFFGLSIPAALTAIDWLSGDSGDEADPAKD